MADADDRIGDLIRECISGQAEDCSGALSEVVSITIGA